MSPDLMAAAEPRWLLRIDTDSDVYVCATPGRDVFGTPVEYPNRHTPLEYRSVIFHDYRLPRRSHGVFAWSGWDCVPVLAAVAHAALVVWMVVGFDSRPWWANLLWGCLYAFGISWNINSVSHNFLHTPYFRARALNRAFSLLESVTLSFSQTLYTWVHLRHHEGNSDRRDANGDTRDWLSIYRYGRQGEPESVWTYVFLGFFRGGDSAYQALRQRKPDEARWGVIELVATTISVGAMALVNWRAVLMLLPFYYLGDCLSQLNGYFEHYRGNPDKPIAWGVSSYARLYNLCWFNNGHHAEHHYRPRVHWTRLPALHRALSTEQRAAGVHVIGTSHALGFLAAANADSSGKQPVRA
jgi:fatty acid desaturase